ncbi:putative fad dependent oxidoreductase [Rosellinia necatrix]|uniref:Putative fad dependent oxidoreductase n=1 Tax=Rosellinia necatrix TaxID=77044 RepID=A0A1W2TX99_ROSNE|nr:putative fad dependent oxidoreductase [Rosellinia necatrix]
MDGRASIPVALPKDNPTRSYWQFEADAIADLRSTAALPGEADTVVVGSGITGAAVAFGLLSDGARGVVMIEARQACSGATGRNGGHTKAASYLGFPHHRREHGADMAARIARLELANIRAVHAFAREHGIDCESNPCETTDVVYDAAQWAGAREAIDAMRAAMPDDDASAYTFHTAAEVRERFYCGTGGSDRGVCGGISYEAGSLNAYKFTIGVLKLCLDRGLNLQTNTPVTGVSKNAEGRYLIDTPRGCITARRVVMATNGYTARLLKKFQGIIVPLRGHVTAQRPGLNMPKNGLPGTYSFFYEKGYDYMIQRPKGYKFERDIIIGGRLTSAVSNGLNEYGTVDDSSQDEDTMQDLRNTLPWYFGDNWGDDNSDGRVHAEWTGIMGYSPDGLPFVGEVPGDKNLWVSASFQGHGMVLCWMSARALVEMMQGRDDEALNQWFPSVYRISEPRLELTFGGRLHVPGAGDPSSAGA